MLFAKRHEIIYGSTAVSNEILSFQLIKIMFTHLLLSLCLFASIRDVRSNENMANNRTKTLIEDAGCPFQNNNQFIQRKQCLMPYYVSSDPPKAVQNLTLVDMNYYKINVSEVEERKNKVTLVISQYMEWQDARIISDFSTMSANWTKLAPNNVEKIWNPNSGVYTVNLQDLKSLYDPHWYEMVGIQNCPELRDCKTMPNATFLFAYKDWKATILCEFDFSSFPIDTQSCEFVQWLPPDEMCFLEEPKTPKHWNHIANGYEITVILTGSLIEYNNTLQNGTQRCGFNVTLDRIIRPYLLQYYFPSMAIVIVSQISFIIPLSAIPGRVALVVTQFLTLTNIFIHQMVRE